MYPYNEHCTRTLYNVHCRMVNDHSPLVINYTIYIIHILYTNFGYWYNTVYTIRVYVYTIQHYRLKLVQYVMATDFLGI